MTSPATSRRSSSGQDAAHSCAETGVRFPPRRSIIRELEVSEVAPSVIEEIMAERHYLRSMPPACVACFAVYLAGALVGGVVLTAGARNAHLLLDGAERDRVATLARLWLTDEIGKNAESRVLGVVARLVARDGRVKVLISYADPAAGHAGTIYQAAGWTYLGVSQPGRYLDLGDGRLHHPRSVFSTYGTNRPARLRSLGLPARSVLVGGKHRYCLVLDKSWAWRLAHLPEPYPARTA